MRNLSCVTWRWEGGQREQEGRRRGGADPITREAVATIAKKVNRGRARLLLQHASGVHPPRSLRFPRSTNPLAIWSLFNSSTKHHIIELSFLVAFLVTVNIKHPSSHSWVIAANRALPIFFTRKIALTTAPHPRPRTGSGFKGCFEACDPVANL